MLIFHGFHLFALQEGIQVHSAEWHHDEEVIELLISLWLRDDQVNELWRENVLLKFWHFC